MSPVAWLVVIFFAFCFVVLLVYGLVVYAYYWSGRKAPPESKNKKRGD